MSAKILAFDQSKRASKIGAPPLGRVIFSSEPANIISMANLSPSVQKALAFRQALREIANLNETIIDMGGDPIVINLEKWWQEAYKNTRGYMEIHPSPEEMAAFIRGEIEY